MGTERITPPAGQPASEWNLSHATLRGTEQGIVGFVEAFRRYGARTAKFGYRPNPDRPDGEPAPADPVTWYCEVVIRTKIRGQRPVDRKVTGECVAEPDGLSHVEAQMHAAAAVVRKLGGRAQVVTVNSN